MVYLYGQKYSIKEKEGSLDRFPPKKGKMKRENTN